MKSPLTTINQSLAAVAAALVNATNYKFLPHSPIADLLMHLCNRDENLAIFIARWIALPLRVPGAKMDTTLVASGPSGTGKNLFFRDIVARLHPQHTQATIGPDQITAFFNEWASRKTFVLVNDYNPVTEFMNTANTQSLKSLLAASSLQIQRKAQAAEIQVNRMNFVFITDKPIKQTDKRRFIVINAPEPASPHFYRKVAADITNEGIAEFREWLLYRLDMNGFTTSSTI